MDTAQQLTTEQTHSTSADIPVRPAPDARLTSAAGVLLAWLFEALRDSESDAVATEERDNVA